MYNEDCDEKIGTERDLIKIIVKGWSAALTPGP
jgi:hypothetical protein